MSIHFFLHSTTLNFIFFLPLSHQSSQGEAGARTAEVEIDHSHNCL